MPGRLGRLQVEQAATPFSYRVWADPSAPHLPFDGPQGSAGSPHPTGLDDGFRAPFVEPSLLTLASGPISRHDPWLADGATETSGNNVDAYADLSLPDGFTPATADTRASTVAAHSFDHRFDPSLDPQAPPEQTQAAITQLFYTVNMLHDWFYDAGFDEASGNAQADNYGRGGLGGDALHAEAQDSSGFDNASMRTPADGQSPRMQMYLWSGPSPTLTVTAPASVAGTYATGSAAFGPRSFDRSGELTLVDDGTAPSTSDGCESPFVNELSVNGHIAVIDRGTCSFAAKAKNAEDAGAIGVVIVNNVPGAPPAMGNPTPPLTITVPVLSLTQADGDKLKGAMSSSAVSVRMQRPPPATGRSTTRSSRTSGATTSATV